MASRVREVSAEEAARIEQEEAAKRAEQVDDIDSDSDDEGDEESLLDRIVAIKDFIPESTRTSLSKTVTWAHGTSASGMKFLGKASWAITTTLLLLVLPLVLAVESEQAIEEAEKEQRAMMQQQRQALNPGLYGMPAGGLAK